MEEKEQIQEFMRQLLVLMADLNDLEKTFISRLRNESKDLLNELNKRLDVG